MPISGYYPNDDLAFMVFSAMIVHIPISPEPIRTGLLSPLLVWNSSDKDCFRNSQELLSPCLIWPLCSPRHWLCPSFGYLLCPWLLKHLSPHSSTAVLFTVSCSFCSLHLHHKGWRFLRFHFCPFLLIIFISHSMHTSGSPASLHILVYSQIFISQADTFAELRFLHQLCII